MVPYTVNMPPREVFREQPDDYAWGKLHNGAPVYNLTIESSSSEIAVNQDSVVVIDPRIATGFDIVRSDSVVLSDITVLGCSNECVTSSYSPSLSMLRLQLRLAKGRYYSVNSESNVEGTQSIRVMRHSVQCHAPQQLDHRSPFPTHSPSPAYHTFTRTYIHIVACPFTADGGHNHHNARIGAWWEGGITEATGDDASNFNSLESGIDPIS